MTFSIVPIDLGQETSSSSMSDSQSILPLTTILESQGSATAVDDLPVSGATHHQKEASNQKPSLTLEQACQEFVEQEIQILATSHTFKLDQALKDAGYMIPFAQAYLCACQTYAAQGRQLKVLSISAHALERIPKQDAHRTAIEELRQEAEARLEQRVDFISQLPIDIVPFIFKSWDIKDIVRSASVSASWRQRIFQCPFLNLIAFVPRTNDPALSIISPWADKIGYVYFNTSGHMSSDVWKPIATGCFRNLRSLTLSYEFNMFYVVDKVYDGFHEVLAQLENSLEELSVTHSRFGGLRLNLILPACGRKLKVLNYSNHHEYVDDTPMMVPDLNLLSLKIEVDHISSSNCKAILRRCCQNAIVIQINQIDSGDISLMDQVCPNILYLALNHGTVPDLGVGDLTKLSNDGATGLRRFSGHNIPPEQIATLFKTHSRTLEYVSVHVFHGPGAIPNTVNIADVVPSMERLNTLQVSHYPADFDSHLAKLIVKCKNLNRFEFGFADGGLPETTQALSTLEGLEILGTVGHGDMTTIVPLYHMFADMGDRSPLREVKIGTCGNVTEDVLAALARISTLQTLSIWDIELGTNTSIDSFLRMLEGHGSLVSVDIEVVTGMNAESSEIVRRINNRHSQAH